MNPSHLLDCSFRSGPLLASGSYRVSLSEFSEISPQCVMMRVHDICCSGHSSDLETHVTLSWAGLNEVDNLLSYLLFAGEPHGFTSCSSIFFPRGPVCAKQVLYHRGTPPASLLVFKNIYYCCVFSPIIFVLVFRDQVFLCSSGCSGTYTVDQGGL